MNLFFSLVLLVVVWMQAFISHQGLKLAKQSYRQSCEQFYISAGYDDAKCAKEFKLSRLTP